MHIRTLSLAAAALVIAAPLHAQGAAPKTSPKAAPAAAAATAGRPDFSGHWELNISQSNFGEAPQTPTGATMDVAQTATSVKVAQTISMGAQSMNNTTDYPLSGKDTTITAPDGLPITMMGKIDGSAMEIDSKLSRQGMDITQTSRWTLSPDGKQLTIAQATQTPMGAMNVSLVFDKK